MSRFPAFNKQPTAPTRAEMLRDNVRLIRRIRKLEQELKQTKERLDAITTTGDFHDPGLVREEQRGKRESESDNA